MKRNSLTKIKRELSLMESIKVTETLSKEKIDLAKLMEKETRLDFDQAMDLLDMVCDVVLSGYRGIEKLTVFRKEIREPFTSRISEREKNNEPNG